MLSRNYSAGVCPFSLVLPCSLPHARCPAQLLPNVPHFFVLYFALSLQVFKTGSPQSWGFALTFFLLHVPFILRTFQHKVVQFTCPTFPF
eukprot:1160903-Pelagomonas_calceolata.AAC.1